MRGNKSAQAIENIKVLNNAISPEIKPLFNDVNIAVKKIHIAVNGKEIEYIIRNSVDNSKASELLERNTKERGLANNIEAISINIDTTIRIIKLFLITFLSSL